MSNLTTTIDASECLTNSLKKLNSNFTILDNEACNLKQQIEGNNQIRTFFYYGDMQDNTSSKPSNNTIAIFVNSPSQLNVPAISYPGDIVYVIYQKTGFNANDLISTNPTTIQNLPNSIVTDFDLITQFAPIFIIWKLTYNGTTYSVDLGFPKNSQASTSASGAFQSGWNNPLTWTTY
jgi:hypothetical protein